MRAARPEYDARSARTADASDIGSRHPARYWQNDCEIALNRKNSLFAGHDDGAINWACLPSLIEIAKLQGIDLQAYLADILAKLVNGWPVQKLDQLLPWAWVEQTRVRLAA
jgi:IS66 C-terminal element